MMSMLATLPAGTSQADSLLGRRAALGQHAGASRELRRDDVEHGIPTLLCASGRGGSGTTLLSALLAVAAAGDGVRVLLIDADEHVGPLSMVLGATAHAGWQDLRGGRFAPSDIVTPISTTLTLVAGGAPRVTSGAALTAAERRACMRRIGSLAPAFQLVVVDCGSQFDNVVSAITPHSGERLLAVSAGSDPIALASTYALCKAVHTRHGALPIDVLVNRHEGSEASRCFDAIDAGARQFLGNSLRLAGAVPADPTLDAALRSGMPFPDAAAGSPAAIAAHDVVMRLMTEASSTRPGV